MADEGKCVDGVLVDEYVDLNEFRSAETDLFIVEGSVTAGRRFQLVVEIDDELGQGNRVGEPQPFGGDVIHRLENAPLVLAQLHNLPDELGWDKHR